MKTLFLIPPSEGKLADGVYKEEKLSFEFPKPYSIAIKATEKDLKCKEKRYNEAINLNTNIDSWTFEKAINRYTWVMYNAIDYKSMKDKTKNFFEENFLILSAMYWMVKPNDIIWNYKLPIETRWLYNFWWDIIAQKINFLKPDFVVNLLPKSYFKMLQSHNLNSKVININFLTEKNWKIVNMAHWVKKVKGEWIKEVCERAITDYKDFPWEILEGEREININILEINLKS